MGVATPVTLLVTALFLAGPTAPPPAARVTPAPVAAVATGAPAPPSTTTTRPPPPPLPVPAALVDEELDLRSGPVAVPLLLRLPTLGVEAIVLGVGITPADVMDAPMGPAEDPVWQQAFWYRGSAVPGTASTALIAGHVSGPGGRPGVFSHLELLRPDDPIVVHDTRSGLDVVFSVRAVTSHPIEDTADPSVLTEIYGAGPVAGTGPQPSPDGLSHLTLITCAGTFRNGTHDHRLVVQAVRVP